MAVGGFIFLEHGLGFDHQVILEGRHRLLGMVMSQTLHALKGPEEIHRGGPGGRDFPADFLEAPQELGHILGMDLEGPQGGAHGGGHPDGRRPPDGQGADGLDHLMIIPDLQIDFFPGEAALVQEPDLVDIPADAAVGDHIKILFSVFGFRFSVKPLDLRV